MSGTQEIVIQNAQTPRYKHKKGTHSLWFNILFITN